MLKRFFKLSILVVFTSLPQISIAENNPSIWNLSIDNDTFVGRSEILKKIDNKLKNNKNIVSLIGNSGVGKTKIASKYARNNKNSYDIVWWFQYNENLDIQFKKLASEISLKYKTFFPSQDSNFESNIISRVKDFLRVTDKSWLLIFDNVPIKNNIENYIPEKHGVNHGHVITTSIHSMMKFQEIEVPYFTKQESQELIHHFLTNESSVFIEKISNRLDNFPLAVNLVASSIKNNKSLTIEEFLSLKQTTQENISNMPKAYKSIYYVIDSIKKESYKAFELLKFISILNNEDIPNEVLKSWYINNKIGTDLDYIKSRSILEKYLVLKPGKSKLNNKNKSYFIHEFIKLCLNKKIPQNEKKLLISQSIDVLAQKISGKHKFVLDVEFYSYLEQILYISKLADEMSITSENSLLLHLNVLEYFQLVERNSKKALSFSNKILPYIESQNITPLHGRFYANMAGLNWWLGNVKEGIPYCEKAIKTYKKFNENKSDLIRAELYLISHYNYTGQTRISRMLLNKFENKYKLEKGTSNLKTHYNKALYHQIKGTVLLEEGQLDSTLKELSKAFESLNQIAKDYPSPKKFLSRYLQYYTNKAEILFISGKSKENLDFLISLHDRAIDSLNIKSHRLIGFTKVLLGHSMSKNVMNNDIKTIKEGINILNGWYGNEKKHREQAIAHIILSSALYDKKLYNESLYQLILADEIFNNCYICKESDEISFLYMKIFQSAKKAGEDLTALKYLNLHKSIFGTNHKRTIQMIS